MTITVFSLHLTISNKLHVSVCLFLMLSGKKVPLLHTPPAMLALTQSPHLASLSTQPWAKLCSGRNSLGLTRKSMTCSNCLGAKQINNYLPQEQTSKWVFLLFLPRMQKSRRDAQKKRICSYFSPCSRTQQCSLVDSHFTEVQETKSNFTTTLSHHTHKLNRMSSQIHVFYKSDSIK